MTDSQCAAILEHLKLGLSVTPMDAIRRWQCLRLAARIKELRKRGHEIDSVWERSNGKRYCRYFLRKQRQPTRVKAMRPAARTTCSAQVG